MGTAREMLSSFHIAVYLAVLIGSTLLHLLSKFPSTSLSISPS